MKLNSRTLRLAVVLAAASSVLVACAGTPDASPEETAADDGALVIDGEEIADADLYAAARGGSVQIVSALTEANERALLEAFEEATGISGEITRLPSPQLMERTLSENAVGRLSFDIVRMTDRVGAEQLAEEGVLVPFTTPFNDQLESDDAVIGSDGSFLSSFYLATAFAYNTQTVPESDAPTSWQDLLEPVFADGKIGLVNANGSGQNIALNDMLIEEFGDGYLEDLAAQSPTIFDSVSVSGEALGRGELNAITIAFSSALALIDNGAPIQFVFPEVTSGAYIPFGLTPVGTENPAAQVYANWAMSKAGQEAAATLGFIPARSDLPAQELDGQTLPTPGDESFVIYTKEDSEEREASVLETWNEIFDYTG